MLPLQTTDALHQPAGGEGHVPEADVQPLGRVEQAQESHHLIVIIKGLATAHEHHVSHLAPFAQKAVGQKHLGEHLTR